MGLPPVLSPEIRAWKGEKIEKQVISAVLECNVWISAAIRGLDNAEAELYTWLGRNDSEVKEIVRKMLFRMLHAVSNLYVQKGGSDCRHPRGKVYAYVIQGTKKGTGVKPAQ